MDKNVCGGDSLERIHFQHPIKKILRTGRYIIPIRAVFLVIPFKSTYTINPQKASSLYIDTCYFLPQSVFTIVCSSDLPWKGA